MMENNPGTALSQKLRNRQVVYGSFVQLPCADAVEITALAGWDFCVLDSEHGAISTASYPAMIRAGECKGMPSVVRVAENRPSLIQQALDAGAAGVLVPQVGSYDSAVAAVRAARFHPDGQRGLNGFVRAADYSALPFSSYIAAANAATVCALQLESMAACHDAERIARIPGLDVLFLGPYDLSQSAGVPGETTHPIVTAEIERVIDVCASAGIASGIYANTPEAARHWAQRGVQFVTCLVDTVLLLRGLSEVRAAVNPASY